MDYDIVPFSFLDLELVDAAPYPLLRIVPDGACVGQYYVSLLDVFCKDISGILENGKYHLAVVHVHLTSVCLYIYLRLGRICYRSYVSHILYVFCYRIQR